MSPTLAKAYGMARIPGPTLPLKTCIIVCKLVVAPLSSRRSGGPSCLSIVDSDHAVSSRFRLALTLALTLTLAPLFASFPTPFGIPRGGASDASDGLRAFG